MKQISRMARLLTVVAVAGMAAFAGLDPAAHAAPAHSPTAQSAFGDDGTWARANRRADGTIGIQGRYFTAGDDIYVEVDDDVTGDVVVDSDTAANNYGRFRVITDYVGCYQNPDTGDYNDLQVYVTDEATGDEVGPLDLSGCPYAGWTGPHRSTRHAHALPLTRHTLRAL